jgi:hypothetical protein
LASLIRSSMSVRRRNQASTSKDRLALHALLGVIVGGDVGDDERDGVPSGQPAGA